MAGLTIAWEYLTGCCVATDPTSRQRAEWPPHPGRVFMALAAAWFETGEEPAEGVALRWLEGLDEPEMAIPPADAVFHREVVTVFVPVNDSAGPSSALLQSAPLVTRSKQPRTFPTVWVGDTLCILHWPTASAEDIATHQTALASLCGKVTRIGHSSSLVRMWLAEKDVGAWPSARFIPDDGVAAFRVRRASAGTLNLLDQQFNRKNREDHERLLEEIANLEAGKKALKGRGAKERKTEIDTQIANLEERAASLNNREPVRPKLGLWSSYRPKQSEAFHAASTTSFDSDMLILSQCDGPRLPIVSTLAVTRALRGTVMKLSSIQPPPSWVSGHVEEGEPVRDGKQHLAFFSLPFVGSHHADGHLLGVALAFPRWVSRQDRGRILGPIVVDADGKPKKVELRLGPLGIWTIAKREWSESRSGLKAESWSAHPNGSQTWGSVTPVVFDGFPKEDPNRDRLAWNAEVHAMLARMCQRVGLPEPVAIDFGTTSWHLGSLRSSAKRRPLRGYSDRPERTAELGDGFPAYPVKPGTGVRPQVHVYLRFADPVVGPVILGAGRFLGYGLCKPLRGGRNP